ncbi:MAG TPA: hypothetical protein VGG09_08800 [Acidimicrobiales bacterium]|jgi:uncharacterized protein (TIGR03086 family)
MEEAQVFVLADRAMADLVARIRPEQWDMTMPPTFATRARPTVPTLRELINYHAYDDAWVPDMLAGLTIEEAGAAKFDGDLLGDAPHERFEAIVDDACTAASVATDYDAVAHLSFGDYPVREYFWQINSFRALRAHDIARAIGLQPELPAALVQGVWDEVRPHAEEWRTIGVFPAAVPVPDDAPLLDRLLGLTGRDPAGG